MHDDTRPGPNNRGVLLTRMRRAWDELETAIASADEARLTAPGADGGWSVRDHLAHITVWLQVAHARVEGRSEHRIFGMDGIIYPATDLDGLNAAAHERSLGVPLPKVLADLRATYAGLIAVVEKLSPKELAQPAFRQEPERGPLVANLADDGYEHVAEHLSEIRALLA